CSVFKVLKKGLSYCVVPTVPFSTRTSGNDFIRINHVCKFFTGVLNTSVRMK
ncbi:MAG: hypothetical protein ACI93P_002246, partial [bacterium]